MTVFPQRQLVWIETLQKDMNNLNEVLFEVVSIPVDEVPQSLQHVLLVFNTLGERSRMELDQLQKHVCKAYPNLKQGLGT